MTIARLHFEWMAIFFVPKDGFQLSESVMYQRRREVSMGQHRQSCLGGGVVMSSATWRCQRVTTWPFLVAPLRTIRIGWEKKKIRFDGTRAHAAYRCTSAERRCF